jgi:hypothetical protein
MLKFVLKFVKGYENDFDRFSVLWTHISYSKLQNLI